MRGLDGRPLEQLLGKDNRDVRHTHARTHTAMEVLTMVGLLVLLALAMFCPVVLRMALGGLE